MDKNKIIQNAQKFIQKGQLDKAIKEYAKIVEADPKDVRTRLKIGDLHAKKGSVRDAADTYLLVAEAYSQQGFFLKAVAVYKQILKLDPNLVDVNMKLADLYHQLGLMSDAMAQYQAVAGYYEKIGDTRSSFDTLRKMLDLDPDNVASRIKLAEMYSKEGMHQEAIGEFRNAAEYLKERNRIEDYIKVVERLVYHDSGNLELTRELANIYLAKGDTKRALAKLQVCFKADPRDVETLHLLARAFLDLGQSAKTISVYKELAKIYADAGEIDQQRSTWRKVLELSPSDPEAQAALGMNQPAAPSAGPPPGAAAPAGRPPGAAAPSAGRPPGAAAPAQGRPPGAGPAGATPAPARPAGGAEMVAKLLTETDVYVKYGLQDKAVEHLKKVFSLDPQNIPGHEKAKDLFKSAGNREAAGQELVTLIQLTIDRDPERAKGYLKELLTAAPGLPEVDGFVARLGRPEAEQVSFLDQPVQVLEVDEVVIADEDEEILIADDDGGFGDEDEDVFGVDGDEDEAVVEIADDEDDDGPFVLADDEDDAFVLEAEAEPEPEIELEPDLETQTIELDVEPEEEVSDATGAFVIDDSMMDGDLDAAMAEASAVVEDDEAVIIEGDLDDDLGGVDLADGAEVEFDEDETAVVGYSAETGVVEVDAPTTDLAAARAAAPVLVPPPPEPEPEVAAGGKSADEVADELEEAEFFIQQGLPDEAREVINGILADTPGHPEALALLQQLDADETESTEPEGGSLDEAEPSGPGLFDDDDGAGFDDFDLAGELADELAELEGEEAGGTSPLQDFQVSADDVFAEFKKGVAKAVSTEDAETHYDLAIAYREMGLTADAIGEFELSAKSPKKRIESLSMIGICYRELGHPEKAVDVVKDALNTEGLKPEVAKALYYELGAAYEEMGDGAEAAFYYRKVHKADPKFRDVGARLGALGDVGGDDHVPAGTPKNGVAGPKTGATSDPEAQKRPGKAGKVGYV